jgi:hypothetical protein
VTRRTFRFPDGIKTAADTARLEFVANVVRGWHNGCEVIVCDPKRNLAQNRALHAALGDVADQVDWYGRKLSAGVWKRLAMAAWLREQGEHPQLIPALDGNGFDVVFEKTSELTIKQCGELLEWVMAFGAEHDVKFTTKELW